MALNNKGKIPWDDCCAGGVLPYTTNGPLFSVSAEAGDKEDRMEHMVLCVVALMALSWWAKVVPWSMAVASRRQAGVSNPRVK